MRDLIGKAELLAGSRGVAAADDGHGIGIGQSLCHGDGTLCKRRILKHAHRAVPDDGLGALDGVRKELAGLFANVKALHVVGDGVRGDSLHGDVRVDRVREVRSDDGVDRQQQLNALGLSLGHHVAAVIDLLVVEQGLADGVALRSEEGVGHAAADDEGVDLLEEVVDNVQLIGDLRTAEDGDERAGRIGQSLAHDGHFLLHEEAADRGQIVRHAGRGGMGAVRRAECIVHKDLRQRSQLLGQLGIVLRLALHEADVLQQHHVAVLQGSGLGLGILTDDVLGHHDGLAEQLAQAVRNDLQGQLGLPFALRLAHMGAKDDAGAVVDKVLNGRHGSDDALVARDLAFLGGDVEVTAAKHALALDIDVFNGFLVVVHN